MKWEQRFKYGDHMSKKGTKTAYVWGSINAGFQVAIKHGRWWSTSDTTYANLDTAKRGAKRMIERLEG